MARVSRPNIDQVIEAFFGDTKEAAFDCVVFQCGTVVRLDCTDHQPLSSFMSIDLKDDFPQHRLPNCTYESNQAENEHDYQWSQTTAYPKECAKAYGCLMGCGYPLPGGLGADRITIPIDDEQTFMTYFPFLGPCCFNIEAKETFKDSFLALTPNEQVHVVQTETAEHRRLDYMFPRPYAYVDKQVKVHKL
jgi:hypothetical protein